MSCDCGARDGDNCPRIYGDAVCHRQDDGPTRSRFQIQVWTRATVLDPWCRDTSGHPDIVECDGKEQLGVALVTLTEDGEWHDLRKAAVWDRQEEQYVGGPPW